MAKVLTNGSGKAYLNTSSGKVLRGSGAVSGIDHLYFRQNANGIYELTVLPIEIEGDLVEEETQTEYGKELKFNE